MITANELNDIARELTDQPYRSFPAHVERRARRVELRWGSDFLADIAPDPQHRDADALSVTLWNGDRLSTTDPQRAIKFAIDMYDELRMDWRTP